MKESDAETQYHDQVKLETKHDCFKQFVYIMQFYGNELKMKKSSLG